MFDFDAGKLLIIGVVALVVIPPKDLPGVMRQVGQILGKMRRMATEFQSQFMDAIREAELDEIRKDVTKLADSAKLNVNFDPVATVRDEIKGALGEGAIAAGSPLAKDDSPKALPSAADTKAPEAVAEVAAAAGIAPLVPLQDGEAHIGEAESGAASPIVEETVVSAPSAPQPSEHQTPAAQEADSGRS